MDLERLIHDCLRDVEPCDHLVQFYDDDARLLQSLEWFVRAGLESGAACIVIATPAHLDGLAAQLQAGRLDVAALEAESRYIPLPARETLQRFLRDGMIDRPAFHAAIRPIVVRARGDHDRPVRAYGEMVGLLMEMRRPEATVELERTWTEFCMQERISLMCGYRRSVFAGDGRTASRVAMEHGVVVPS